MIQLPAPGLGELLLAWYRQHGRVLPWRNCGDPYAIWLSEVVLQQTRIDQGLAYWRRFLEAFPDVHALAQAPLDAVLKQWEGLGYYSRAHNLHRAAQQLDQRLRRNPQDWPKTVQEWRELPGVGPYTARAVASLAFGAQAAVVDGNVYRILSRLLADGAPIDTPAGKRRFQAAADTLLQGLPAAELNQAMMDLGATVCTPRKPDCPRCPWRTHCRALGSAQPTAFPVKQGKAKRGRRYYEYWWVQQPQGELCLRQRDASSYWKKLWELPGRELPDFSSPPGGAVLAELKHAFTHFDLYLRLVQAPPQGYSPQPGDCWLPPQQALDTLAFPRALRRLFEQQAAGGQQLDFSG